MFEKRLRLVVVIFVAGALVLVMRLFQLQVLQASVHEQRAEQRLVKSRKTLEPIRGRILDRYGKVLASDEPAWSIALHYRLLRDDPQYYDELAEKLSRDKIKLGRHARRLLRGDHWDRPQRLEAAELTDILKHSIDGKWVRGEVQELLRDILQWSACNSAAELASAAREITQEIDGWKTAYLKSHEITEAQAHRHKIAEEYQCHPIVGPLSHEEHVQAQRLMQRYAWLVELGAVEIQDSSTRTYHQADCLAHVLGHLRETTSRDIEAFPYRPGGSALDRRGYKERDQKGASGVERLGEDILRGQRGMLTTYRDNRPAIRIREINGQDVSLTIDYELQRRAYELLKNRVEDQENFLVPGGSVVVLDVPSRQVLTMVSYPAFDPNKFRNRSTFDELSHNVRSFPLHFRAVYSQYEPGSIIKPLTILAALSTGVIDRHTMFDCRGKLFPNNPSPTFRCWRPVGSSTPIQHGLISSEQAIKGSCNVFCWNVANLFCELNGGRKQGVQRMCEWLEYMGLGQKSGLDLPEEKPGLVPWPEYLASTKGRSVITADARNYAIGQGELQITPIQAANLAATYAGGQYRQVRLLDSQPQRLAQHLPVKQEDWQLIRRGMYQVVNESGGTARIASLNHPSYALCGKSGSATTTRWITEFRVSFQEKQDTKSVIVSANNSSSARTQFETQFPDLKGSELVFTPSGYWPTQIEPGSKHSHAWFIAFIQPKTRAGLPDWHVPSRIAIAVLLEFGGSGGRTSGPLCREVAELIIDEFPQYVEPTSRLAGSRP